MNTQILRKVQDIIRQRPEHLDMYNYFSDHTCGSAACIAGWILVLNYQENRAPQDDPVDVLSRNIYADDVFLEDLGSPLVRECAEKVLGIPGKSSNSLFEPMYWPPHQIIAYNDAVHAEDFAAAAEIVCRRIDEFIAENEHLTAAKD